MDREKQKQAERLQSLESQYQLHLTQLQQQLSAVEKERNICMVCERESLSCSGQVRRVLQLTNSRGV